ncbi:hypothetical protein HKX48_006348 [Thoreauomyces humboldtii]|nr:hypothetical protein HKX48_006348 [Thoreauomyces humboldtii]
MPMFTPLQPLPDLLERPEAPEDGSDAIPPTAPSHRRSSYARTGSPLARQPSTLGLSRLTSSVARNAGGFDDTNAVGGPGTNVDLGSPRIDDQRTNGQGSYFVRSDVGFSSGLHVIPAGGTPDASASGELGMLPSRSRRHSFAEHGETLTASSGLLGDVVSHVHARPGTIRVGEDGRPHPQSTHPHPGGAAGRLTSFSGMTRKFQPGGEEEASGSFDNLAGDEGDAIRAAVLAAAAAAPRPTGIDAPSFVTPDPASYDPYPSTWPTREDVRRARRNIKRPEPEKDDWTRAPTRFERSRKSRVGPGTYVPDSWGTRDHHTPRTHPSVVPRFPRIRTGTDNPNISPGCYKLDVVKVDHGFKPWIMTLVPKTWVAPTISAADRRRDDGLDIVLGFADARRRILGGKGNEDRHPGLATGTANSTLTGLDLTPKTSPPATASAAAPTTSASTGIHIFSAV